MAKLPVLQGCSWVMSKEGREKIPAVMLHLVLDICSALDTVLCSGHYKQMIHIPLEFIVQWERQTGKEIIISHGNKYYNKSGFKMLLEQRRKLMNPAQRVSFSPPFSALNVQGH